jgi:hypothetical protein
VDFKAEWQLQVLDIAHEELINCASHEHSEFEGDFYSALWWNSSSGRFKPGDRSLRIFDFLPLELGWQVPVVDKLEVLSFVLAMVGLNRLFDSCVDLAKFDCFTIEIHSRHLDFAEQLEEE